MQFNVFLPHARRYFKAKGGKQSCKSIEAWCAVVGSRDSRNHDSAHLLDICHHFQAWDAATASVIEQAFSGVGKCHGENCTRLNEKTECDEAKVASIKGSRQLRLLHLHNMFIMCLHVWFSDLLNDLNCVNHLHVVYVGVVGCGP